MINIRKPIETTREASVISGVRKADHRSRRRRLLSSSTNSGGGLSALLFDDASIVESSPFMVSAERQVNWLAIFELYYDF